MNIGIKILALILIGLFGQEMAANPSAKKNQPHIILIMTDQHRGDAIGAVNSNIITPNLDKLVEDGVCFVNAYSSTPSCTPARAGLLTGMSPWQHGMIGFGKVAPKYKYEMPQMLRDLGYYTFGIGKMHWTPQRALHGFYGTLLDEKQRGEKLHPTYWTGQMAKELIRNYDLEQPLFLKISFHRPHSPYDPPAKFLEIYKNAEIPEPVIGEWANEFAGMKEITSPFVGNFGKGKAINARRHYYANITFIDEQVGEIISMLKEKGMYENAIICFTSDHGDMLGDHNHWRKTFPFEGSAKIPYLLKWPEKFKTEVQPGTKIEKVVELRDFLPTFIDAAGGEIPEEMDGKSLLPLLQNPDIEWRPFIDLEHAAIYYKENYWCALTDGHVKYIWYFSTGQEMLFDLDKDPNELENLISNSSYKKTLNSWKQQMADHLAARGETFVKSGKPVIRELKAIYSPNYPEYNSDHKPKKNKLKPLNHYRCKQEESL